MSEDQKTAQRMKFILERGIEKLSDEKLGIFSTLYYLAVKGRTNDPEFESLLKRLQEIAFAPPSTEIANQPTKPAFFKFGQIPTRA